MNKTFKSIVVSGKPALAHGAYGHKMQNIAGRFHIFARRGRLRFLSGRAFAPVFSGAGDGGDACWASGSVQGALCTRERRSRGYHVVEEQDPVKAERLDRLESPLHVGDPLLSAQGSLIGRFAFFKRLCARQTRHAREALCDERHVVEPAPAPRFGRRGNVGNGLGPLLPGGVYHVGEEASQHIRQPLLAFVFVCFHQKGRPSFVAEAAHAGGDVGELAFGYGIATVALQASPGRAAARAGSVIVDELQAPRASRA